MTQASVPVYEEKVPQPEATTPLYTTGGKIVGYIKPYDFYIRYQVAQPHQDNVHRVMFNDGTDVKLGYITEKLVFPSAALGYYENAAIEAQKLNGHDIYTYVEYIPSTNSYKLHDYNSTVSRDIFINKSVPYFDANGNYVGMLNKVDYIKINRANSQMPGKTRPWTNYIDGIKFNGEKDFNNFKGFVSLGLEYGSSGPNRAWH